MLISDFVEVDRPYADVRSVVLDDPRTILEPHVRAGYGTGEALCLRLAAAPGHRAVGKRIQLDISAPYERDDRVVLPIQWWATGITHLFPRLEADLEFVPSADGGTRVSLMGRYDPPLGGAGRGLDRLVLHRLAEASVRAFLVGLAEYLESPRRRPQETLQWNSL